MEILKIMSAIMLSSSVLFVILWPRSYYETLCFQYWGDGTEDKVMAVIAWVWFVGAVSFPFIFTA